MKPEPGPVSESTAKRSLARPKIVAVAASTGGPQALQRLLSPLPADFPVPIVLVQHIATGFVAGLVQWLAAECAFAVKVAASGTSLNQPAIYVAPSDRHLTVARGSIVLTDAPPVSGHRPSATVLFRSVARAYGASAMGIVLSGMGDDGASGLADLQQARATTVAQDEASAVIFSMPSAAINTGAVDYVLPPERIADLVLRAVGLTRAG
jgi:two-component system chemotaxis response regulator CheB